MTEKEKMLAGRLYRSADEELVRLRGIARDASAKYNATTEDQVEKREAILRSLLGSLGKDVAIFPDVKFDYGFNVYIGNNVYINFNCVFLDCAEIRIGNDVFVGPNVSFLTPIHPLLPHERNAKKETKGGTSFDLYCKPITIEDNVWIGGGVTVTPGVTIGNGAVIGAGSVVTKDIPSGVVAAGVPCRVIRDITEADSVENLK